MKCWYECMVFGLMAAFVPRTIAKSCNEEKRPYGYKMCEQFCSQASCSPDFSFPHLTCNVTFLKLTRATRKYTTCRFLDQAIRGNRSITKKDKDPSHVNGDAQNMNSDNLPMKPGLLLAPVNKRHKVPFHQMNLSDPQGPKVREYPRISAKSVTAISYTPLYEAVYVSTKYPYQMYGYNVKDAAMMFHRDGLHSFGMAVDDNKKLLFLTMVRPTQGVSVMSLVGSDFIILHELDHITWELTLDRKRELIFSCGDNVIFSLHYNGTMFKKLMAGPGTHGLTLDHTGQVLYYNKRNYIYKFLLKTKQDERIGRMNKLPSNVILYKDFVYVAKDFDATVSIVHLTSLAITSLKIRDGVSVRMCLIPED